MICETCEQPFQSTAVKVYQGKKVCTSCFHALTTSDIPKENKHLHIVQSQEIRTTVCPECNAEVHIKARTCPRCGAVVQRVDQAYRLVIRLLLGAGSSILAILGFLMAIGVATTETHHFNPISLVVSLLSLGCFVLAATGFFYVFKGKSTGR